MADGFEADRTEAYFNGGMKPLPVPRRLKPELSQDGQKRERAKGAAPASVLKAPR